MFGASAFDAAALRVGAGLPEDLKRRGEDIAAAMYRAVGDWMRGTSVPAPYVVAQDGAEDVGGRRFRHIALSGHTSVDLCLFEETSGLLFAGDLVFLDRAATTPDADLDKWRASLDALAGVPHRLLVPGHGPVEPGGRGIAQTRRWLDMIEARVGEGFGQGFDVFEMSEVPLPDRTDAIAVARYEYQRLVQHLLPGVEANLAGAFMDGAQIRYALFENAWMQDCRGRPLDWQADKPVREEYPAAKQKNFEAAHPRQK
ncbi:MBL fold metallo-hydrolase [Methylocella sp.]|uniref:MBL fold metallo-hydrolase n=1 Tax=Methylocella sp. TaxID=1978226 RepID=UPI0037839FD5